ncbi:MAG: hypothetical protein R3E77_16160 [Steroidobacteraceae bacterium]
MSSPHAVLAAIQRLFARAWPGEQFSKLPDAFADFADYFAGRMPGYNGVDTAYHDTQHTLDITLAMARLMCGYELTANPPDRLGAERAELGILTALFHDVGYLRQATDGPLENGAELTARHVSRGATFLSDYLPRIGCAQLAQRASLLVHYTGYEIPLRDIPLADPLDRQLGELLGTADYIAQMSDRCYLEKCRDRLYLEFVLGGIALQTSVNGRQVRYASGLDLLRQTPGFITDVRRKRLDGEFRSAYRHVEALFDGRNPYMESLERNLSYLTQILRSESWKMLRRNPPVFAAVPDPTTSMRSLMLGYLKRAWAGD